MPFLSPRHFGQSQCSAVWVIFIFFFSLYVCLAWIVCGGDTWWVIDFVDGQNIFFGDDAYRFFLSRSAWKNPDLYTYNFVLPGQLVLDGAITYLVQGDLFLARSFHAAVGAAGLCLLYLAGLRLDVHRHVMLSAILIMGLLPRYALMSLSFYGELWLGFLICLSLWLLSKNSFFALAMVASWMPLFRPEGIFFVASIGLFFLLKKRPFELLILLLPGAVYFVFLCFSLSSIEDFFYWRTELRKVLAKMDYMKGDWDIFFIYSWFLTVPAMLAVFVRNARNLWPLLLGGGVWLVWLQVSIIQQWATFESRYTYILLPPVVILWAIFFSCIKRQCATLPRWLRAASGATFAFLVFFVLGAHIFKTNNIDLEIKKNGYAELFEKVFQGRLAELYGYYPKSTLDGRRELVSIIHELLEKDAGIDKVAIYTAGLYYYLDPHKVPKDVTIGFLAAGYMVFHILLDGQSFIQHPGGSMYTYLNYGEPDFKDGEKRVLVATIMPLSGYPYTWIRGSSELYLFSYLESWEAQVDISTRPTVTQKMIDESYSEWYFNR